ncbi:MAG: hypothetical protein IKH94_02810 [Eubacterium sp.]|nr:hypothetical protein [Eubacterium sp.]
MSVLKKHGIELPDPKVVATMTKDQKDGLEDSEEQTRFVVSRELLFYE